MPTYRYRVGDYVQVPDPANPYRRVYEHRLVMEQKLGRKLGRHEYIRHLNGDKTDNRPENLELIATILEARKAATRRLVGRPPRPGSARWTECVLAVIRHHYGRGLKQPWERWWFVDGNNKNIEPSNIMIYDQQRGGLVPLPSPEEYTPPGEFTYPKKLTDSTSNSATRI